MSKTIWYGIFTFFCEIVTDVHFKDEESRKLVRGSEDSFSSVFISPATILSMSIECAFNCLILKVAINFVNVGLCTVSCIVKSFRKRNRKWICDQICFWKLDFAGTYSSLQHWRAENVKYDVNRLLRPAEIEMVLRKILRSAEGNKMQ